MMRLKPSQQTDLMHIFCKFLSEQVKDIRLRSERSLIQQGVTSDSTLNSVIFLFLSSFLKWESNYTRTLPAILTKLMKNKSSIEVKEQINECTTVCEKNKILIMQDCDQYVKMLFHINKYEKNQVKIMPEVYRRQYKFISNYHEVDNVVIFQLLQNFNHSNMRMLFGRR